MTRNQALEIVAMVVTAYPAVTWSEASLAVWAEDLLDLDYAAAKEGATRYRRTCSEFPSIAGLRAEILCDLALPGVEAAWAELHDAIQRCTDPPKWSHPAIGEALRLTGRSWADCRLLQFDQYPWLKRDFAAAYCEWTTSQRSMAQLAGGGQPQLRSRVEARQLLETIRAVNLNDSSSSKARLDVDRAKAAAKAVRHDMEVSCMSPEMTAEEIEARRVMLRDQMRVIKASES